MLILSSIVGQVTPLRALAVCALVFGVSASPAQAVTDSEPTLTRPDAQDQEADDSLATFKSNTIVSQALLDAVERMDSPEFQWALSMIQNTGVEVRESDFSWQIGLRATGSPTWCGGTLISKQYVLTAAHCVDRNSVGSPVDPYAISDLKAFRSSTEFGMRPVALDVAWPIKVHQSYKAGGPAHAFDAALLKLAAPVSDATPAPVARKAFKTGPAVTSGWGDHPDGTTGKLRAVIVPVVDATLCRDQLPSEQWDQLGPQTICTVDETADACARDSGGPLVVGPRHKPQIIGIVSWGGSGVCGNGGVNDVLLGGYTRTSEIADWVLSETGDASAVTNSPPGKLMEVMAAGINRGGIDR